MHLVGKLAVAAAVAMVCGCSSWRNGDSSDASGSGTSVPSAESAFIREAGASGKMEVELGRVGVSKASNAEVRSFAQRMVADHSEANAELGRLASARGITVPEATAAERSKMDSLSALTGAEFDRRFMSMMVDDHKKAVSKFEAQARSGKDAAVRDFASRTLPTLREHLRMAEDIARRVGG